MLHRDYTNVKAHVSLQIKNGAITAMNISHYNTKAYPLPVTITCSNCGSVIDHMRSLFIVFILTWSTSTAMGTDSDSSGPSWCSCRRDLMEEIIAVWNSTQLAEKHAILPSMFSMAVEYPELLSSMYPDEEHDTKCAWSGYTNDRVCRWQVDILERIRELTDVYGVVTSEHMDIPWNSDTLFAGNRRAQKEWSSHPAFGGLFECKDKWKKCLALKGVYMCRAQASCIT